MYSIIDWIRHNFVQKLFKIPNHNQNDTPFRNIWVYHEKSIKLLLFAFLVILIELEKLLIALESYPKNLANGQ